MSYGPAKSGDKFALPTCEEELFNQFAEDFTNKRLLRSLY
jgi:hypothetical protein